jgi:outer membrane lipoprotein-sorting protein
VRRLGVRARWAVPAAAVAAVGIVAAATAVASAAVPSLPHRTAAQLLAAVSQGPGKPLGPFTATVQETAGLGLPQLPQIGQSAGGTSSLASGTHSITIWYRDPQHLRIAEPVQAGESDLRLNGRVLWLWNSKTQTATRVALPAHVSGLPAQAGNGAAGGRSPKAGPGSLTPQAAASEVLKAVGPSTVVSVQSNAVVAGQDAYQLELAPRTSQSLIASVVFAIDANHNIPLRVQVFGRDSGLVYSVGFTSLTFGTPDPANFSFTPPPGATVHRQTVPGNLTSALKQAGLNPAGLGPLPFGSAGFSASAVGGSLKVVGPAGQAIPGLPIPKQALAVINAKFAKTLPVSMSAAQREQAIKKFDQHFKVASGRVATAGSSSLAGNNGGGSVNMRSAAALSPGQKIIGKDWLSVVATPANPQVAGAVQALVSGRGAPVPAPSSQGMLSGSSSSSVSSSAYSSTVSFGPTPGPYLAWLQALLLATSPVHGNWGSGRLLQTKVLSVLITSKGQVLAGAVTPGVLYADVAADAG